MDLDNSIKIRTTRKKTCTHTRVHRVEQKQLENPCAINDDGGGGDDDGMRDAFGWIYDGYISFQSIVTN